MNCQQIERLLNEYLDDQLSAEDRDQVRRHLDGCPDCQQHFAELQSVVAGAGHLPSEVEPSRDLWPGVLGRIDQKRSRESAWWLHLAAAGIALAILWVPLSVWWVGRQDEEKTAQTQTEMEIDSEFVTSQAQLARSEDGVLLARTDLVTAIEKQRDVLEEDTLRVLEDNMVLLDQAIGELRVALDNDPQNLRLRMLLASRYQQERKLLQKVSRV